MPLERLALTNYRCFAERQEVELRPITVVLGKNNSGKSALVRAPIILATGIRNDTPLPLDLVQLGDDAPEFVELIHQRLELSNISVSLGLADLEGARHALDATIQNVAEWHTHLIRDWSLRSGDNSVTYEWASALDSEESELHPYRRPGGPADPVWLEFKGLLPTALPQGDADWFDAARVRSAFDVIRHLGPFRTRPKRLVRLPAREPEQDEFGSRTAEILITDHVRRKGRLTRRINDGYLRERLPGWELEIRSRLDGYAVGLRSRVNRDLWVPATDSGTGIAQVLPILVRRAQDEIDPPQHDVLEIIEEPELHLHPAAQADLAELFIQAVDRTRVRFLIETHSETFLLRLRRRVAEGRLDPARLALYFVHRNGDTSTVDRIQVDDYGNVDHWPAGIFSEDFEETAAMAAAQLEREDSDAG